MKNKRFIYILIAIVLIAGFLFLRNRTGETGDPVDSFISTVSEIAGGTDTEAEQDETADVPDLPDDSPGEDAEDIQLSPEEEASPAQEEKAIDEDGVYDSKEDVALYIHTYGKLPSNYITKAKAKEAGWSGNGGDKLDKYCPGKCIGGDYFGNNEGLLPKAPGRKWSECDIGTLGAKNRGVKRIVFSNDGLIYYTADHYETFELLYGEP